MLALKFESCTTAQDPFKQLLWSLVMGTISYLFLSFVSIHNKKQPLPFFADNKRSELPSLLKSAFCHTLTFRLSHAFLHSEPGKLKSVFTLYVSYFLPPVFISRLSICPAFSIQSIQFVSLRDCGFPNNTFGKINVRITKYMFFRNNYFEELADLVNKSNNLLIALYMIVHIR